MPKYEQLKSYVTKICETCGREFVRDYGYSIAASWLVTGHCAIQAFTCELGDGWQHWGCTPEHAMEALNVCLTTHIHVDVLKDKHANSEHSQVAPDDTWILEELGDNFPFTGRVAKVKL